MQPYTARRLREEAGALLLALGVAIAGAIFLLGLSGCVNHALAQDGSLVPGVDVDEVGAALEQAGITGWKAWAFAVVAIVLLIELFRWVVPGFERESGVKLGPKQRATLAALALVGGQAAAFGHVVAAPAPGPVAAAFAGLSVTALAVVLNESIWKRLLRLLQDRLGIEPPRVKRRKAEKLAAMTTGQFRAHRAAEQAEGGDGQ